jgi:hypothetical protein
MRGDRLSCTARESDNVSQAMIRIERRDTDLLVKQDRTL